MATHTHTLRTVGRSALLAFLVVLPFAACSDDGDGGDEEATPTTEAPSETDTSDGTLPATDPRIDAALEALDASISTFEPPVEVQEATVDLIVIGPVDADAELDPETAELVCNAALTVALGELPTAQVTVVDGDGTPMVGTSPAGCGPVA